MCSKNVNLIRRYHVFGSRTLSNYWWGGLSLVGGFCFFIVGLYSYYLNIFSPTHLASSWPNVPQELAWLKSSGAIKQELSMSNKEVWHNTQKGLELISFIELNGSKRTPQSMIASQQPLQVAFNPGGDAKAQSQRANANSWALQSFVAMESNRYVEPQSSIVAQHVPFGVELSWPFRNATIDECGSTPFARLSLFYKEEAKKLFLQGIVPWYKPCQAQSNHLSKWFDHSTLPGLLSTENKYGRKLAVLEIVSPGESQYDIKNPLKIAFFPQGLSMCFYGLIGVLLGTFVFFCIVFKIGSGFTEFNKEKGTVRIFRLGFPGKNRYIDYSYNLESIQCICVKISSSIVPSSQRGVYMRLKVSENQTRDIPLDLYSEKTSLEEIELQAADLSKFLRVSLSIL